MGLTETIFRNAGRLISERGLPETHKVTHVEPAFGGGALVDICDNAGNLARVVELSEAMVEQLDQGGA